MIRRFVIGIGLVVLALLCLPALPPVLREMLAYLPTGWFGFLRRTLPEVTVNWHGLGMVGLCSAIILVALHSFCGWLYRAGRAEKPASGIPDRWPLRRTTVLFASFWILFAVVMGAAGLRREIQWVLQSDVPLYLERRSGYAEIQQADGALATALVENPTNIARAHAVFMSGEYERLNSNPTLWEQHHVLIFTNKRGEFVGSILVPRNPQARDRIGFLTSSEGTTRDFQPMTNLPTVIAELEKLAR